MIFAVLEPSLGLCPPLHFTLNWPVFTINTCPFISKINFKGSFSPARMCLTLKWVKCAILLRLCPCAIFGRPFVKRFALCYRTAVLSACLSGLSCLVLVYCGQTVGRIKMKLDMQVGIGPGHIVLDRDRAPPKGVQPPTFGLCPLWPNGWMD